MVINSNQSFNNRNTFWNGSHAIPLQMLGSYLASLTQMSAKVHMRSTKEIKLSAASIKA